MARALAVAGLVVLALAALPVRGANWERIGSDAGMSKYFPENIPSNAAFELKYVKRLYSRYTSNTGNFFYASAVVTHNGQSIFLAEDRPNPPASNWLSFFTFDWQTGQTQNYYRLLWYPYEHNREVDSHHYTNPVNWNSDGRVYFRRGGDTWYITGSTKAFIPSTGEIVDMFERDERGWMVTPEVDNTALMATYKDMLICRYGHTFSTKEYYAGSIADLGFLDPYNDYGPDVPGKLRVKCGPTVPATAGPDGIYGDTGRYGDIPKCANDVCVIAAQVYDQNEPSSSRMKLWLQATDLAARQPLWAKTWTSDSGGARGFYTSVSDYWRFIATDSGHYVFFTRASGQPVTLRAVDLRTGEEKWSKPMANAAERPLLAYNAGFVYVIGRAEQFKLDVQTGGEIWKTTNSWPNDRGYILGNHENGSTYAVTQDPLYRPALLTDETLWFIDGDTTNTSSGAISAATLVGIRTSDGAVLRQWDLRELYADKPNESIVVVNDLMMSDGLLGLLIGVKRADSPHPNSNNMDYQDLYVYRVVKQGDTNGDGKINVIDLLAVVNAFGTGQGQSGFNPAADLDKDNAVGLLDLLTVVNNFGR